MKKFPHTYVIVFIILVIATILTWIVPSGQYERITLKIDGQEKKVINPHSFRFVEKNPQTIEIFTSFYQGFVNQAHIIVFILIVGGTFNVINSTNAIGVAMKELIKRLSKSKGHNPELLILSLIFITFSLFGAIFGMSEETLAFVSVFVSVCIALGFDSITGVSVSYLAAHIGFAGAFLNPFTIGIAQVFSNLPLFSGLEYRMLCWFIINLTGMLFVLSYALKIKNKKITSLMQNIDKDWIIYSYTENSDKSVAKPISWIVYTILLLFLIFFSYTYNEKGIILKIFNINITIIHLIILYFLITGYLTLKKQKEYFALNMLIITIFFLIVGVIVFNWYIKELCGLFFASGIVIGISYGFCVNELVKKFIDGCKDILSAALVVGLAGGIIVILNDANIIDTILYYISKLLNKGSKIISLAIIYIMQNCLNIIIPSGSAKAALTIPITSEFVDLIGISRQINVLAFQFGDGFTNFITPTSGVLLGALSIAKIPYNIWFKFIWRLVLLLIILGFFLLIPPLIFSIKGY